MSQGDELMISVIIPTYNAAAYIYEALDSVLAQTYKDYEIIVIDDGSTDDTKELIEVHYPAVKYFYVENNGVSAARNLGIVKAQGEFIAFLDADDMWLPEKLEKQLTVFGADESVGLVFTENYFFNDQGLSGFTNKKSRLMRGDIVKNIFLNSYAVTSTVMVRKSVFKQVGLFEEELSVAEDDNMWMRIAMKFGVELIDECLVMYRMTAGSLSSNFDSIVSGVERHLELLKVDYPELYSCLGPLAIRKKFSHLHFSQGYRDFNQNNFKISRIHFIGSYKNYPFKLKSLLYILYTYLPVQTIETLRDMKRGVTSNTA